MGTGVVLRVPNPTTLLPWLALSLGACVDAPITSEHLADNGRLRASVLEHAALATARSKEPQQAVHVSAVLAAEKAGALSDSNEFLSNIGSIHLHLRADSLVAPRQVVYRWTHGRESMEFPGVLAPTNAMKLAASHTIAPHQVGMWRVEVVGIAADDEPPPVLFQREFEVVAASNRK